MLLIGAMMCLLAALWAKLSVSAGNGWPNNVLRHHWLMPISCHFRDCKALLVTSLTHVSGDIASVQIFYLLPLYHATNLRHCIHCVSRNSTTAHSTKPAYITLYPTFSQYQSQDYADPNISATTSYSYSLTTMPFI